ncbi:MULTISPECIES: hypothetical protein [Acinetobacter]|jgi:hypothetical protein|uniref:hypothetical protein n=1 Tax=Acinetobacter TaxID=469 RepID=UPI00103EC462|nr:hypothetical protein [Acinetobacter sp. ANC 3781]TCB80104.1 hypothetical protein E0H89_00255 [Acinetobacter sp. ANC 3781]
MKTKIFITTLFLISLTGCEKSKPTTSEPSSDTTITAQFEQSNDKIHQFIDQLDDPDTPQDVRIQILYKDYSTEYKTNYLPSLMKLSPGEYTEGKLINDLDIALGYYKKKDNIQC